jgi:muconate cycloisomerase
MRIEQVNIYGVLLPFSVDFSHSLRKRSSVKNIVVEIVADQGEIKGYGEGAPRIYVTGESQESASKTIYEFIQQENFPWDLREVSQIWDFVDSLPSERGYNTAICALEMALLDALGKKQNRYLTEYLPKNFYTDTIYYGAALPLDNKDTVMALCRFIKRLQIYKLKLKMGTDLEQNKEIIEAVSTVWGDECDLKIDINCVWDLELALRHLPLIQKYRIKVVEQPMMPDNPEILSLSKELQSCGVILMADESVCSLSDLKKISEDGHYQMINIRLSKCGGFRRSFEIIDFLRDRGFLFQIGCQLGESGLLSAAGRVLSLLNGDALYFDGSYDEYLLKENTTEETVSFGPGGIAGPLKAPGLGVTVKPQRLAHLNSGLNTETISRT